MFLNRLRAYPWRSAGGGALGILAVLLIVPGVQAFPPEVPKNPLAGILPKNSPKNPPTVKSGFTLDRFEQLLNTSFGNGSTTMGYEYAIYQGETLVRSGATGWAVQNTRKMSADVRISTASITKTITATSMMKALEIVNPPPPKTPVVDLDSPIINYLPSTWVIGPNVDTITIRDLLTHYSGLPGGDDDFDSLAKLIKQGANKSKQGHWNYVNANFCLIRVMVPNMLFGRATIEKLNASLPGSPKGDTLAQRTAKLYVKFVQEKVFGPIGLGKVGVGPVGPNEVGKLMYYDLTGQNPPIADYESWHPDYNWFMLRVGSGHWYMSAKEYGLFLAKLRHGKIVSAASFTQMTTPRGPDKVGLGLYQVTYAGGTYFNHGGGGFNGMGDSWLMYNDDKDLTIIFMMNSAMLDPKTKQASDPRLLMEKAYTDALK